MHTSNNGNTATTSRKRQRTCVASMETNLYHLERKSDWRTEQVLDGFRALISSLLLIHNFVSEPSWKALQKKILTAGPDELKLKPPSFYDRCRVFGSQKAQRRRIKMTVMQQMRDRLGKPVSWEGFGEGGGRRRRWWRLQHRYDTRIMWATVSSACAESCCWFTRGDHHNKLKLKRKGQDDGSFNSYGDSHLCQKQSFLLFLWRIETPSVSSLTLHGVAVAGLV